ncbi:MAG TPA: hypothetical protein VEZ88_14170 [Steroidobacteraceae bacterium]|nr:hypothetical protein [Steroidobacteraceae bacterium]
MNSDARPGFLSRAARMLLWLMLSLVLLIILWTLFTLNWSYGDGERAGVLQKFSRKGWVCKTYEGELALYVVGGVAPEIWHFSVRDDSLAPTINQAIGQRVRLHYTEHPLVPTTCFAETRYFVNRVEPIKDATNSQVTPVQ